MLHWVGVDGVAHVATAEHKSIVRRQGGDRSGEFLGKLPKRLGILNPMEEGLATLGRKLALMVPNAGWVPRAKPGRASSPKPRPTRRSLCSATIKATLAREPNPRTPLLAHEILFDSNTLSPSPRRPCGPIFGADACEWRLNGWFDQSGHGRGHIQF